MLFLNVFFGEIRKLERRDSIWFKLVTIVTFICTNISGANASNNSKQPCGDVYICGDTLCRAKHLTINWSRERRELAGEEDAAKSYCKYTEHLRNDQNNEDVAISALLFQQK